MGNLSLLPPPMSSESSLHEHSVVWTSFDLEESCWSEPCKVISKSPLILFWLLLNQSMAPLSANDLFLSGHQVSLHTTGLTQSPSPWAVKKLATFFSWPWAVCLLPSGALSWPPGTAIPTWISLRTPGSSYHLSIWPYQPQNKHPHSLVIPLSLD